MIVNSTEPNPVQQALEPLIGLKLSIARRAADMRNFQFGEISKVENGSVGEYALHISCPLRIDGPEGIITGRGDLWEHISGKVMPDDWEPSTRDNLQDARMEQLLKGYDPETGPFINTTDDLVVKSVKASRVGDAIIELSGGYRILLFPQSTKRESWRIFQPGNLTYPRFVVDEEGPYSI